MKTNTEFCECSTIHAEVVQRVGTAMPTETLELANLFKNFADGTRVKILWALSVSEMCVCDISTLFGMTISAVSHQLKVLRNSNLVKFRREGKVVYYSLADDHVRDILSKGYEHVTE